MKVDLVCVQFLLLRAKIVNSKHVGSQGIKATNQMEWNV